jgi:DNA-binding NtrC family response regulator
MSAQAVRVLSLSSNPELQTLRNFVLMSEGFRVLSPSSKRQALETIEREFFDCMVLCHSLSQDSCNELAQAFKRRNPESCVIHIVPTSWTEKCANADVSIAGLDGPEVLIEAVRSCGRPLVA